MLVLIAVTTNEQMVLWYEKGGAWKKTRAVPILRNATVAALAELFKETGEAIVNVTGIGVLVESSRFTTVRLVVTIANMLAFVLQVSVASAPPRCSLKKLNSLLAQAPLGRYLLPEYQASPRLGGSGIK